MLPYVQQQIFYALGSGVATWLLLAFLNRPAALRDRPRRRFLAALGVLGMVGIFGAVLIRLSGRTVSSTFVSVAFVFYGGALWLPVLTLAPLVRRRRVDPVVALASVALLLLAGHALFIEPNRLQERHERIELGHLPDSADPIRVVHISDIQTVGWGGREESAVKMIAAARPDIIVVTGDYAAGPFFDFDPALHAARRFLAALSPRIALVCVAGHSETERHRRALFEGLDIVYLRNRGRIFDCGDGRRAYIWGADVQNPKLPPARAEGDRMIRIFASHVPDLSDRLDGLGVDLHLAGHTHGGQIVVPFFGAPVTLSRLPRRFARGLHEFGDHLVNIAAGIGMEGNHAPRIRFLCPPEICVLDID